MGTAAGVAGNAVAETSTVGERVAESFLGLRRDVGVGEGTTTEEAASAGAVRTLGMMGAAGREGAAVGDFSSTTLWEEELIFTGRGEGGSKSNFGGDRSLSVTSCCTLGDGGRGAGTGTLAGGGGGTGLCARSGDCAAKRRLTPGLHEGVRGLRGPGLVARVERVGASSAWRSLSHGGVPTRSLIRCSSASELRNRSSLSSARVVAS